MTADTRIAVALHSGAYDVVVAPGGLDRADELLRPWLGRRAVVVTDEQVAPLQLPRLSRSLARSGVAVEPVILPAGEGAKSWRGLETLCEALIDARVERRETILALGGGVVGDLAGLAAALVKRGVGIVQIPTTLLAQVDSSVGGKTAINTRAGKNMVGAFHQPSAVLVDPTALDTLPDRDLRAGYAEIAKIALIGDAVLFDWLERSVAAVLARDSDALGHAITAAIAGKAAIVARDPQERTGERALLNLGHTFGHALEAEAGFDPERLRHGEAVAAGTAVAFALSQALGLCAAADADRVIAHLAAAGLPTTPRATGIDASGATLVAHMAYDKKASGGRVPLILARGIGNAFMTDAVGLDVAAELLDRLR